MATASDLRRSARIDERAFYADPWDVFAELRREEPVFWYEPGGFWVVTRYEDVRHVAGRPELFSNAYGIALGDNMAPAEAAELLPQAARERLVAGELNPAELRRLVSDAKMLEEGGESIGALDPPRHARLRKLVMNAFTPRMVARYTDTVERIVQETFDRIEPGSTTDLVEAVSVPIPALVMAEFLGVEPAERDSFVEWANSVALIIDETDPARREAMIDDVRKLREYCSEKIGYRTQHPGPDLLSAMNEAELDGEKLSHANKIMFAFAFLFAGNETTRHLISGSADALARHPEQRALLVERPELIDSAVDEMLRWVSPVWGLFRTATDDTEIAGRAIAKHDWIYLVYASANRDEAAFERADELDVLRSPRHLAFGYGTHFCMGASLARLEGRLALRELLRRFPDYRLAGDAVRLQSTIFNGTSSLPVEFVA